MKELDVENAVTSFYKEEGFWTLPRRNDIRWGKFSFYDGRNCEPDVVAFKWEDDYSLLVKTVECKLSGTHGGIRSALDQILTCKRHFPWCYIATMKPGKRVLDNLSFLVDSYHVGYMPVIAEDQSTSVDEESILEVCPKYINTDMDDRLFTLTRQKLVMLSTFVESFGEKVNFSFDGDRGYVNSGGDVQYYANNYASRHNIKFGLNIERQGSVKKALKNRFVEVVKAAKKQDLADFTFEIVRMSYSSLRPLRPMMYTFLRKPLEMVTVEDSSYLEGKFKEWGYQIEFTLMKEIWKREEFLSRREHLNRLEEARKSVEGLRNEMGW